MDLERREVNVKTYVELRYFAELQLKQGVFFSFFTFINIHATDLQRLFSKVLQ